ncbi:MAG: tyrosine-type recombinase/integrase [Bacteroidales bacterium]|nr:tyrosine-type recombinase/integrase [Bacteroidales bacterium]
MLKKHNFTLHCLRHGFSTHLHESGHDIRIIKEISGHRRSNTTEIIKA